MTDDEMDQELPGSTLAIRAELRLRNATMINRRKQLGWSQSRLAEHAGVTLRIVADLEKLDYSREVVRDGALSIAVALGIQVDDILPPGMDQKLQSDIRVTREVQINHLLAWSNHQSRLILPAPDMLAEQTELKERLIQLLQTLPPRHGEVLKLRYGIDGPVYSTEEIAARLKIGRQRVHQIEQTAIRRLQHPSRSKKVEGFLDDTEPPNKARAVAETTSAATRRLLGRRQRLCEFSETAVKDALKRDDRRVE